MYSTVQGEAAFFITCIGLGILTAFLYDIVRISRRIVKVGASVVNGEDVLFFALAAVSLFYAAYFKNGGEIRWHGFLGGALGLFGYAFLVRNRFVNLGTIFTKWLIKSLILVIKTALFPLRIILKALKKPVGIIAWYTGQGLRKVRRVAKCQSSRAKMRILSAFTMSRKK